MMYNYPFFGFPRFRRSPYYYGSNTNTDKAIVPKVKEPCKKNSNYQPDRNCQGAFSSCEKKKESQSDEPLFELFGLKLYSDDILLICLIFFLYQEGVDDQYLFISLILLLLS